MPADLFSSFLGMTLQGTGNNNNAWGTILNGSALQTIEKAIAGNVSHAVTGGTLDLSGSPPPAAQTQVLEMFQAFTGILTSNQVVKVPNLSKFWVFANQTTGAFQLLLQTPSGTQINIPQSTNKFVVCDGNSNLIRLDRDDVGTFVHSAGLIALPKGVLACNGASYLRTDYPELFAFIGTTYGAVDGLHFTVPFLTDTGRYLRAATGPIGVGTYQSNQNAAHTHTASASSISGTTNDPGNHTHANALSDPGHTHTYNQAASSGIQKPLSSGSAPFDTNNPTTTSVVATGITITNAAAGAHTHTVSGTAAAQVIASSGGTESRPESLSVAICIRY